MKKRTTHDLRYLESKEKFLGYAYSALNSQFESECELVAFFDTIKSDVQKSLFLRTASFYVFLVKCGDWNVDHTGSLKRIDYLSATIKFISIFALIESLSEEVHIDFFQYLASKKRRGNFPIENIKELEKQYQNYKSQYGSIGQCVSFFEKLSEVRQKVLISKLTVKGAEPTIEELAKYLYRLRSEFVHGAELVHEMTEGTEMVAGGQGATLCSLSIEDAMLFFEEGLVAYFKVEE